MRIPHMLLTALILFFATSGYALPQEDKLPALIRNISVTVLLDQILIYEKGRSELESEIRKIYNRKRRVVLWICQCRKKCSRHRSTRTLQRILNPRDRTYFLRRPYGITLHYE